MKNLIIGILFIVAIVAGAGDCESTSTFVASKLVALAALAALFILTPSKARAK